MCSDKVVNLVKMGGLIMEYTSNYKKYEKINDYKNIKLDIPKISNIGWSLGNACPYNCKHCYSLIVRKSGKDLTEEIVDRVISQISKLNVKTVNLGGNEPWFTNGLNGTSMLPYILEQLHKKGFLVGITTSGITLINLLKYSPHSLRYVNDVDISLDSADEQEHNRNRGANVYHLAIRALEIAVEHNIPHSIIMCAMNWNFNENNLKLLVDLARKYNANIRFNTLKPIESQHMNMMMTSEQYYRGFEYLLSACDSIDLTEPRISALTNHKKVYSCPCGNTSLRIHSITDEGKIFVSPCIYLHDFKVGDLLKDDIIDIISSEPFSEIRKRAYYVNDIDFCKSCKKLEYCGGGCAATAYLVNLHKTGKRTLMVNEYDCPKMSGREEIVLKKEIVGLTDQLVHMDYLCTWIGKPKKC